MVTFYITSCLCWMVSLTAAARDIKNDMTARNLRVHHPAFSSVVDASHPASLLGNNEGIFSTRQLHLVTIAISTPQEGRADGGDDEDLTPRFPILGKEDTPLIIPPTFALVPKVMDNPFFDVSGEGCRAAAEALGVDCLYVGPTTFDATGGLQVELLESILANATEINLQGIAISAVDADSLGSFIETSTTQYGIPIVTFDSDAPETKRSSYIGTDNFFFGTQLAKVLKQVHPNPGHFAIISANSPNIMEREKGVRDHLAREGWQEVATSPSDMDGNSTTVVDQMFQFAKDYPDITAIVPVMGAGMRAENDYWTDFVKAYPEILLVVADAMPNQLLLLDRQQCQGLVGQLPYEMGVLSVETLYQLYTTDHEMETDEFIGTNVLEHLLIPLNLPEYSVDNNLVGELRYVGYVLFGLVFIMGIAFSAWTFTYRDERVVKVAQPKFLILVAFGTLVMCSALLPLGFDDSIGHFSEEHGVAICMSPLWLLSIGFTLTFTALLAKIYRVNKLFESSGKFIRVKVSEWDTLTIPLFGLLGANGTILICWTVLDPLQYVRKEHSGTDGWDRTMSTYGSCQGDNLLAYLIPLFAVNGMLLIFANWTAYKARHVQEEFAESKYVGMAMASMLQASLSGIPILMVVQGSPQAFYIVVAFMIFIMCSAILLLIFVPKMVLFASFKKQSGTDQQARIQTALRESTISVQRGGRSHLDSSTATSMTNSLRKSSTRLTSSFENAIPEESSSTRLSAPFANDQSVDLLQGETGASVSSECSADLCTPLSAPSEDVASTVVPFGEASESWQNETSEAPGENTH